ncbi:MAG: hypothetical protein AB1643_01525 [Patescibacteria group bacterium]
MLRFKLFFSLFFAGIIFIPAFYSSEAESYPAIYLFHGEECPHCKEERIFLTDLKKEIPDLNIIEYEVWHNDANRDLFLKKIDELGIKNPGVPLTIIGDKYLIGFNNAEDYGQKIKEMILGSSRKEPEKEPDQEMIKHPFFGEINIKTVSLSFLAVSLGTLDGFNPCSMWSLLVLLTLAIAGGARKKVWLVGSVFIITSYISYFLFMSAWLNVFVWLDYLVFVRLIVGIIALIAGVLFIRAFFTFKPDVCEISSVEGQKKITKKIENIINSKTTLAIILGVAGIAFSVNIIELLCSLGIPVVFTKILTEYHLATWKYYAYIGLYDFFYMLDDIIVLLIAGFSMKFFHLNSKYSQWSRLIAGIIMLILGLIFLIKPELLIFSRG